jgi:hypothetical protein
MCAHEPLASRFKMSTGVIFENTNHIFNVCFSKMSSRTCLKIAHDSFKLYKHKSIRAVSAPETVQIEGFSHEKRFLSAKGLSQALFPDGKRLLQDACITFHLVRIGARNGSDKGFLRQSLSKAFPQFRFFYDERLLNAPWIRVLSLRLYSQLPQSP